MQSKWKHLVVFFELIFDSSSVGEVYIGLDLIEEDVVAIKKIKRSYIKWFEKLKSNLVNIDHPNIVKIKDVYTSYEYHFFVMEM